MLNGNASAFDRMAYSVINEALNNSCHNIDSEAAREQMQKQIYKSVVHCTPYESIYDVMCGRRQFYFQGNVVNTVLYLIWFVALWFHLTHGFWSAIHTIGWNNTVWLSRWECISKWVATIICGLFAVITVIFYLNGVGA